MVRDSHLNRGSSPIGDRTEGQIRVTVGVEQVLYLAAVDSTFRTALLNDRATALFNMELTPAEATILGEVDRSSLERMIEAISVRVHGRRRFMQGVAAVATGAAVGTVVATGVSCGPTGIRPDPIPDGGMQTTDATDLSTLDPADEPESEPESEH
jgi:hypothetical protein